jgi:plastocyanin
MAYQTIPKYERIPRPLQPVDKGVTTVLKEIRPSVDAGRRAALGRRTGVALLAPTVLALLLAACGGGGSKSSTATTATTGAAAPVSAITITIQNFAFHPDKFSVTPGATITVRNEDTAPHTLTATNHSFTTGQINPGATGTVKAPTTAGSYPYFCTIHNFMTGTLTVS